MGHTASVDAIDALLPQTQCTRCGYNGCLPYAQALASGEAAINRCPPGGSDTIQRLAELLDTPVLPLDASCGVESTPQVVWIDPQRCIGCARCLPPCPVDAIVGAQRQLHVVLEDRCTGCELCIAPCPVDCIVLRPGSPTMAMRPSLRTIGIGITPTPRAANDARPSASRCWPSASVR